VGASAPLSAWLDVYSPVVSPCFPYALMGGEGEGRTDLNVSDFVDASSTAKLSVAVLTECATYVADSGTVYAVPEPSEWLMMLAGCV
jgi:hypothetical protein